MGLNFLTILYASVAITSCSNGCWDYVQGHLCAHRQIAPSGPPVARVVWGFIEKDQLGI